MIDRMQIPFLSMTDMFREISEQLGGKIIDHEGRYITYASPSFLYARNFILDAKESEIGPILKEIHDNLSKGLPGGVSFIKELAPENIAELFAQNGFVPFISQTGMIFDLANGFSDEVDQNIAYMTDEQMGKWSVAVSEGFPKPMEDAPFIALNKCDNVLTYGYMDGDEIGSTGMLLMHPEYSGIHEISTVPPYRNKGQATAIIIRMLQDLKQRGFSSVSLQASDAGRDYVYAPLGFESVCTIPTFIPA